MVFIIDNNSIYYKAQRPLLNDLCLSENCAFKVVHIKIFGNFESFMAVYGAKGKKLRDIHGYGNLIGFMCWTFLHLKYQTRFL